MKNKQFRFLLLLTILLFSTFSANSSKAEEVYMIRGFLNVFSNGINQMTSRLRSNGIKVKAISNGSWQKIAADIIKRSKTKRVSYPIVIAGHSLGGVEAASFANALGRANVPTALLIGIDPGFQQPPALTKGAKAVYNYKIPAGKHFRRGSGFSGNIKTIDVSRFGVDHVSIDKNRKVQDLVIQRIRATVKK